MAIRKKTTSTRWIWIAAAVAVLLIFYLVPLATRTRVPIRTAVVIRSEIRSTIATNGRVEPQHNWEAHAPFPALVKSLHVHEGQHVSQGELLLCLDDQAALARAASALAALTAAQSSYSATRTGGTHEEILALNGDLEKTRIEQAQAQRDLDALKKLQATGAASASEVAAAQERLATANTSLQVLESRKSGRYDADDLGRVRAELNDARAGYAAAMEGVNEANVHAPFAGTVYSVPVSVTEYVQQGDMLLQMADLTKMQVLAYFDEPEIGKLSVGQPILITWNARPANRWHGHIARVPSTVITYTTRNVGEVLITIDDADEDLLPNTNVIVTVTTGNDPNALNIPHDALHSERGQRYVYRIVDGVLHRTEVKIGNFNLTQVQILSGLKEGDVVALNSTNGETLGDHMAVTESR
jgi:HlyD family secretion protein